MFDVIVAGSGASGVHAAQTLVEQGLQVCLVDAGIDIENSNAIPPNKTFETLRTQDSNQEPYLLGSQYEAINWGTTKVGAQLTPARKHLIKDTDKWLPYESDTFFPFESLAVGGLGSGWGAGCHVFSPEELKLAGLDYDTLIGSYQKIVDRIGVSKSHQDLQDYTTRSIDGLQSTIQIDHNCQSIINKYNKNKHQIQKHGFRLGQPSLAILSQPKDKRSPHAYKELEFYSDHEQSVYRPWITLNTLKQQKNFTYIPGQFIKRFKETSHGIELEANEMSSGKTIHHTAKKLVLALGALGSARVVLRSFPEHGNQAPLLCNPYTYYPTLFLKGLFNKPEHAGLSLSQLLLVHDPEGNNKDVATASVYAYKSLMLFRLIKEAPIGFREARSLFQYLQNGLLIFGIHHPDSYTKNKFIKLRPPQHHEQEPQFQMHYSLTDSERAKVAHREKQFAKVFKQLGCMPLKKVTPGFGASIHYGGTLPYSSQPQAFTTHPSGRLHLTQNVYVADGSGLTYLPAKGVTLTLMAIADHVASNLVRTS